MQDNISEALGRTFDAIYNTDAWGNGSGPGSEPVAAHGYLSFITDFILRKGIKTVLDVGCGDGQLANAVRWSEWGCDYLGVDVSGEAVRRAEMACIQDGMRFRQADIIAGHPTSDLALVKDVLQHLPYADCRSALRNLQGCKYVLVTGDVQSTDLEVHIEPGGYRPIEITRNPLNWNAEKVWDGWIAGWHKATYLIEN